MKKYYKMPKMYIIVFIKECPTRAYPGKCWFLKKKPFDSIAIQTQCTRSTTY